MPIRQLAAVVASLSLALLALSDPGSADQIEDFYKGKTVRVIIGYGPGGGYDLYGRVTAEYLAKFIPGNPTVVPQNMPGAGSFAAAKYLYEAAPRDGTVLGMVAQTFPLDAAMKNEKERIDASQMPYIGRLTGNVDFGHGMPGAKFKTFDDARAREIVVGATGGASPALLLPKALNKYGGAKFKIITGYAGSNETMLAAERGEIEMVGANGLAATMARRPEWVTERKVPILYQATLKRHPLLPHVPALPELGLTEEGKAVLTAIASSADIGRAIVATPGVPEPRLTALRKAFQQMLADPAFLAKMKERSITIEPATGEELDQITRDTMKTPKRILELTAELLKE
jgi:tripartite-type tricarboxylate transporter receptor subunit TctC